MRCNKCGAELDIHDKFCGECGTIVDRDSTDLATDKSETGSDSKSNEAITQPTSPHTPNTVGFSFRAAIIVFFLLSILLILLFGTIQYFFAYSSSFYEMLFIIEDPSRFDGLSNFSLYVDPLLRTIASIISLWLATLFTGQKLAGKTFIWAFCVIFILSYFYKQFSHYSLIPMIGWNYSLVPFFVYPNSFFEIQYNHLIFAAFLSAGLFLVFRLSSKK